MIGAAAFRVISAVLLSVPAAQAPASPSLPALDPAMAADMNGGARYSMETMRRSCPVFSAVRIGREPDDLRECRVSDFGEFGNLGGWTYYYAVYCLIPNDTADGGTCADGSFNAQYFRERALAVFVRRGSSGPASLLLERASADVGIFVYRNKPEIVATPAGTLLYVPVTVDGTGSGNASEYYLWRSQRWEPIDAETWLADLQRRLPGGLETRMGIWPDVRKMIAETGLYRRDDANCCPTGGTARIRLAIRSGRFVLVSVAIEPPR